MSPSRLARSAPWPPTPRQLPTAIAALALAVLGLACSGGDDPPPPAPTTTVPVPTTSTTDPDRPTVDGTLKIGVLVPRTGSQTELGPGIEAAAQLAVDDLNAAGGVLGKPVEVVFADAGDATTDTAGTSVDQLAGARVDLILGPPSSAATTQVVDKVARSTAALATVGNAPGEPPAGVPYLQFAPGLDLLGTAVGEAVASNGLPTALIVARDDRFGQRVSAAAAAALQAKGVVATVQAYNPESEAYAADVDAALAAGPAQVVFVGYAELADFVAGFALRGVLPAAFPMFVVTDRLDDALFRRFTQPGELSGMLAIGLGAAQAAEADGFADRVRAEATEATTTMFAAEVYDAVAVAALAAAHAGTDDPEELQAAVGAVTGGSDGADCADVAACLEQVGDGDVTYVGQAGPYRLGEDGVATEAAFALFPFGADNRLDVVGAQPFRVTAR